MKQLTPDPQQNLQETRAPIDYDGFLIEVASLLRVRSGVGGILNPQTCDWVDILQI